MKKILSIMAAAAIFAGCCSCSEKKKEKDTDKNDTDIVSETVGTSDEQSLDEPVEQEFRTYSADYFKTININTNVTDAKPPIKEHSINISQLDFGSRIPPCKDEKYIDQYKFIDKHVYDDEYRKQLEEIWEKSKTEPTDGENYNVCIDGRYIYLLVNYDTICEGAHEVSIFRLDSETNEQEEIFRHSDPVESCRAYDIYCLNGVVYLYVNGSGICYLDEEKQELVNVKELSEDVNVSFRPNSAGRFIVELTKEEKELVPNDYEPKEGEELYSYDGTQTYLMKGSESSIEEFDFDTKTWKQLYYVKTGPNEYVESGTPEYPEISGKYFAWKEKPEKSRKFDIVTEKYRVSTGLTGCEVRYADDDKVIAIQYNLQGSGANESRLHIYDLKKAEHYIIDSSKYGSNFSVLGDGLIVSTTSGSGDMYYLMPELGMFFELSSLNGVNMSATANSYYSDFYKASGDVVSFHIIKQINPHEIEVDGAKFTECDFEDELYWFTLEE